MKKLLFAALLATVAVGGAYAQQQYSTAPSGSAGTVFTCSISDTPTCRTQHPDGAYLYPNGTTKVTLPNLFYDPI